MRLARCANVRRKAFLVIKSGYQHCDACGIPANNVSVQPQILLWRLRLHKGRTLWLPSYKIRQMDTKAAQSKSESKATVHSTAASQACCQAPSSQCRDDFGSLEDDDDDEKPGPAVKVQANRTMPWSHMSSLRW